MLAYMRNLKSNGTNELIYQKKQSYRLREHTYCYVGVKVWGEDRFGVCDWHVQSAIVKIINKDLSNRTRNSAPYSVMT